MLHCDLYAIRTDKDEYNASIDEYFPTFEDAMNARFKYANWYRPYGDVTIVKYEKGTKGNCEVMTWYVNPDGTIAKTYNWKR